MTSRLPTFFISHGGGPWPWMEERAGMYAKLAQSLGAMPSTFGAVPKALLVITAHWEEHAFTVQGSAKPPMIYDYYGFPPHTYSVVYGAPGMPALAARVRDLIANAGLPAAIDPERGFDHGTFTPLAVMYPGADMPIVQLSLKADFDPAEHIALGRALAPLRDEGVLILGSGLSYHNLRAMGPVARAPSKAFDDWLGDTLVGSDPATRERRLVEWEAAPAARFAHPREEHLLPLMVAVGAAADEAGARVYHEDTFFGGVTVSSYRFGAAAP